MDFLGELFDEQGTVHKTVLYCLNVSVSGWKSVTNDILQDSVQGVTILNIFISDIDSGLSAPSVGWWMTPSCGMQSKCFKERMLCRGTKTSLISGPR